MLQISSMPIDILFENDDVIAVSKPAGQVVIPGRGDIPGSPLVTEVERYLGRKAFVVHRIDRGASGIVLFAKDPATHRHVSLQFEQRQVFKKYLVLVQGVVAMGDLIDQPLRAFGSGRMGIHPQGKESKTEYTVREVLQDATLLEVSPLTGRRHQIRVHLYSIGHPVMGDPLYGKERPVGGIPRLMLHAWKIECDLPDGQRLSLEAELPGDFKQV